MSPTTPPPNQPNPTPPATHTVRPLHHLNTTVGPGRRLAEAQPAPEAQMQSTVTPLNPHADKPSPADSLAVLATMVDLGKGPLTLGEIADESEIPRSSVRAALKALTQSGLCTVSGGTPAHYKLLVQPADTTSHTRVRALPSAPTAYREELRALQQRTHCPVLLHSYLALPPQRLCIDLIADQRIEQALKAAPEAANQLRAAPLDVDAPGKVIAAHLALSAPTIELQRIRSRGFDLSPAPIAGSTLLSVPVYARAEQLAARGPQVAGAVSLLVSGPLGPNGVPAPLLEHLHHTATELTQRAAPAASHVSRLRIA